MLQDLVDIYRSAVENGKGGGVASERLRGVESLLNNF
jgi:hypothetical protein